MRTASPVLMQLREIYFNLETVNRLTAQKVANGLTILDPIRAALERQAGYVLLMIEEAMAQDRKR